MSERRVELPLLSENSRSPIARGFVLSTRRGFPDTKVLSEAIPDCKAMGDKASPASISKLPHRLFIHTPRYVLGRPIPSYGVGNASLVLPRIRYPARPIHSCAAKSAAARPSDTLLEGAKILSVPCVRKSMGYGMTAKPTARKQATARGIWLAEVTSNQLSFAHGLDKAKLSSAFSHVSREISSISMRFASTPGSTGSRRATADSDRGCAVRI